MNCENEYCIYNRDFHCILEDVSLDAMGMCNSCITVELAKKFLEAEKERQLREISESLLFDIIGKKRQGTAGNDL